jgi:hypothetical protein
VRALWATIAVGLAAAPARAGGLALDPISPRGVGRAGASMVSDDGAAAVVVNPAALARRDARRVQLGLLALDDDVRYDAPGPGVIVEDRGGSTAGALAGGAAAVGPVVVGAVVVDAPGLDRRLPAPVAGQPVDVVERLFPHRYAGLEAIAARRTIGAGVAWRATEWLAIGGSATVSRVELAESRRVWAGFGLRDPIGGAARDVTVEVRGVDPLVPGAAIGVLVAPVDVPVELSVAAAWAARAELAGTARARAARPGEPPRVRSDRPAAEVVAASPLVLRSGARWLGERWIAEVTGELWTYPGGGSATWRIRGLDVIDDTGASAPIAALDSRVVQRTHGALRGAVDVEVVGGFVWLTAGWAWATAATPADRWSPAAGDLGGHTGAIGAEISSDGVTVTIGLARTFAPAIDLAMTRLVLDNPFAAGTAPVGLGRHDLGRDVIAVSVEIELP